MEFHPTAGSIRPGPPAVGDVAQSRLRDSARATGQLQRQRVDMTEGGAGGGAMQGFTRATPMSAAWSTGGVVLNGWAFDYGLDRSSGVKPGLTADGSPYFGVVKSGWYVTHVRAQATISSGTPVAALVQANTGFASVEGSSYYAEEWALISPFDSRYRADFWVGPFWLAAGDAPLGVEMHWPGTVGAGDIPSAFVDVWRVG